jgi:putative phosphoribosyl transferase
MSTWGEGKEGNTVLFRDRYHAGRELATHLRHYLGRSVIVLGLPRGGVPVAFEVAAALEAPLDVFLVRKLGVPGHEELAMGAIASGGIRVLNERVIEGLQLSDEEIDRVAAAEIQELQRRNREYRDGRPPLDVRGKTVILVDDGLATGSTMRAALAAVRQLGPRQVVVAVPVGAHSTCRLFEKVADEVVCCTEPEPFYSVGRWYEDFSQTTDDEVRDLLEESRNTRRGDRKG